MLIRLCKDAIDLNQTIMAEQPCDLGIIGLTSVGQCVAAHFAQSDQRVCVGDEDQSFVPEVVRAYQQQTEQDGRKEDYDGLVPPSKCMVPSRELLDVIIRVKRPRKIVVFGTVANDAKFLEIWNQIVPQLEEGDTVLRWGREEEGHYETNIQQYSKSVVAQLSKKYTERGINLLEMIRIDQDRTAIWTEANASNAYMVGGPEEAFAAMQPYIAPFVTHVGLVGTDAACVHIARVLQHTVENCIGQAYAEGMDLMAKAAGFDHTDIGRTFNKWNSEGDSGGRLTSYLLKASSRIMYKRDNITKQGFVIDYIREVNSITDTDTFVYESSIRLGVPTPCINAALEARLFCNMKEERIEASEKLEVPAGADTPSVLKEQMCADLQSSIYCTILVVFAEAFTVFQAIADRESWDVNIQECMRLWNVHGSFLRSKLLDDMHKAYKSHDEDPQSILLLPGLASELAALHMSWRRTVTVCFASALPVPTLSAALTHYDMRRTPKLPMGMIQSQRDFFSGCGYERNDQPAGKTFSSCWTADHTKQEQRKAKGCTKPPVKRKRKSDE